MSDKPKILMDQVREYFATVDDKTFLRDVKEAGFKVADKPQPLHEQLMELAGWLEHEARLWNTNGFEREALIYHLKAAKVRTLAEQAKELEEAAAHAPSS